MGQPAVRDFRPLVIKQDVVAFKVAVVDAAFVKILQALLVRCQSVGLQRLTAAKTPAAVVGRNVRLAFRR